MSPRGSAHNGEAQTMARAARSARRKAEEGGNNWETQAIIGNARECQSIELTAVGRGAFARRRERPARLATGCLRECCMTAGPI
eukprot:7301163-Pyramimonas_sp.AAC.1